MKFLSSFEALNFAYYQSAQSILQKPSNPARPSYRATYTPHERHAMAAKIIQLAHESTNPVQRLTIEARFRVPINVHRWNKRYAIEQLARKLDAAHLEFCEDVIGQWAGFNRKLSVARHAKRSKIRKQTLCRLKSDYLIWINARFEEAMSRVDEVFYQAGVFVDNWERRVV